eukprot:761334-Hanusia_phi.AAC.1
MTCPNSNNVPCCMPGVTCFVAGRLEEAGRKRKGKRSWPEPPKRNKAVDRGKTKELLDCLDCLVPVRVRPLSEEKGKLESRRTVRAEMVLNSERGDVAGLTCVVRQEEDQGVPAMRSSGAVFHGDVLRNGMSDGAVLVSELALVVELFMSMERCGEVGGRKRERGGGRGVGGAKYRNSPFRSLIGQNLLHFIDYADRWKASSIYFRIRNADVLNSGEHT